MIATPVLPSTDQPTSRILPLSPLTSAQANADYGFKSGDTYIAQVLARVDSQTLQVKVGNNLFKMQLGSAAAPGETLTLKYLNSTPTPTFALSGISTPNLNSTANTTLSTSALSISQLMQPSEQGKTTSILSTTPINPTQPQQTAQLLAHTVNTSGLFYESHLTNLLKGTLTREQIMQEPQNTPGVDPNSLIPRQLNVLTQNQLHWTGEVWPGQTMDWITKKDDATPRNNTQSEQPASISSTMSFNFGNLGKVKATLQLHAGQVKVQFTADNAAATQAFKDNSASLSSALQQTGIPTILISDAGH
jgi:flagellar hook-length control protein FliK